jgi:hypothetical protein
MNEQKRKALIELQRAIHNAHEANLFDDEILDNSHQGRNQRLRRRR